MSQRNGIGLLATVDGLLTPIYDAAFVASVLLSVVFLMYWLMFCVSWLGAIMDGTDFVNRLPLNDTAIFLNALSPVAAALTLARKISWTQNGADNG